MLGYLTPLLFEFCDVLSDIAYTFGGEMESLPQECGLTSYSLHTLEDHHD